VRDQFTVGDAGATYSPGMSSPYLLAMRGNLVVVGYQPDGDSIRFIADEPAHFDDLYRGYKIRLSSRDGSVQLRLEGIDAPELHYGRAAQPDGNSARDWLLAQVGFSDVKYQPGSSEVAAAVPDAIPAVIYTKASDPNGRPIAYLHVGTGRRPTDGTWTAVTNSVLDHTVNAHALSGGIAYPTFYTSTPAPHIRHLRAMARGAREDKAGVWAVDQTPLFQLIDQGSIDPNGQLILPKLFRRATDYLKDVKSGAFRGNLADWLRANNTGTRQEDDLVLLPGGVEVPLSTLVEQRNSWIAFTPDLMEISFVEK
jgi:endonuclease YncB( thermonuclease family)